MLLSHPVHPPQPGRGGLGGYCYSLYASINKPITIGAKESREMIATPAGPATL